MKCDPNTAVCYACAMLTFVPCGSCQPHEGAWLRPRRVDRRTSLFFQLEHGVAVYREYHDFVAFFRRVDMPMAAASASVEYGPEVQDGLLW